MKDCQQAQLLAIQSGMESIYFCFCLELKVNQNIKKVIFIYWTSTSAIYCSYFQRLASCFVLGLKLTVKTVLELLTFNISRHEAHPNVDRIFHIIFTTQYLFPEPRNLNWVIWSEPVWRAETLWSFEENMSSPVMLVSSLFILHSNPTKTTWCLPLINKKTGCQELIRC